jgi:hypothetical protein
MLLNSGSTNFQHDLELVQFDQLVPLLKPAEKNTLLILLLSLLDNDKFVVRELLLKKIVDVLIFPSICEKITIENALLLLAKILLLEPKLISDLAISVCALGST